MGLPGHSTGAQSMWNQGPITSFCGWPDWRLSSTKFLTSPLRNASYQPPMCSAGTRMRAYSDSTLKRAQYASSDGWSSHSLK